MIFHTDFDKVAKQRLEGAKRIERIDEPDKIVMKPKAKEVVCPPTPDGYYSAEDVAAMFKCIHDKKISQNTASAYLNVFKNVLEVAYKDRRITDNLADMLDNIPCKETTKNGLSLDEVRMLSASECEIPVIRRAAIFSYLSNLRISDILNLKWKNIRNYADGTKYLDFICVKTKRQTIVPISTELSA